VLAVGASGEQIAQAWIAVQELRLLYRCATRVQAPKRLYRWCCHYAATDPELDRLPLT